MKSILLVALSLIVMAGAAQGASRPHLADGRLVVENGEKAVVLSAEECPVGEVWDAQGKPLEGLRYCGVGDDAGKAHGLESGLYVFDGEGSLVAFAPNEAAEYCAETRLSPGKKILAMDSGGSLNRSWFFFSYPDMKPLGEIAYLSAENKPAIIFDGDKGAFFSSMDIEGGGRACGYDPCGPVSVDAYFFDSHKTLTLFPGTDLCDFTLTGFSPETGEVGADKLCLASAKAWENYPENAPVEKVGMKVDAPAK